MSSATDQPRAIVVPACDRLPEPPLPVRFADYLLNRSAGGSPVTLHAELGPDHDLRWYVSENPAAATPAAVVVAQAPSAGFFRAVLVRFGHRYMSGQLYGGTAEPRLLIAGRPYAAALAMANDLRRGCWLKVCLRPLGPGAHPAALTPAGREPPTDRPI